MVTQQTLQQGHPHQEITKKPSQEIPKTRCVDAVTQQFLPPQIGEKFHFNTEELTLETILGSGGEGTTYLVSDRENAKHTLKILFPGRLSTSSLYDRVQQRLTLVDNALGVNHQVAVLAPLSIGVLSPFVEGRTLEEEIAQSGRFKEKDVIECLTQISCNYLQQLHDRNLIHRDVKPSNIICTTAPDGHRTYSLIDFGTIKDTAQSITLTASIQGTLGYTRFKSSYTAADDYFSLARVAYFMMTEKNPEHIGNEKLEKLYHTMIFDAINVSSTLKEKLLWMAESVEGRYAPFLKKTEVVETEKSVTLNTVSRVETVPYVRDPRAKQFSVLCDMYHRLTAEADDLEKNLNSLVKMGHASYNGDSDRSFFLADPIKQDRKVLDALFNPIFKYIEPEIAIEKAYRQQLKKEKNNAKYTAIAGAGIIAGCIWGISYALERREVSIIGFSLVPICTAISVGMVSVMSRAGITLLDYKPANQPEPIPESYLINYDKEILEHLNQFEEYYGSLSEYLDRTLVRVSLARHNLKDVLNRLNNIPDDQRFVRRDAEWQHHRERAFECINQFENVYRTLSYSPQLWGRRDSI